VRRLATAALAVLAGLGVASCTIGRMPLTWTELTRLPLPDGVAREAYGPAPAQFGELRVPQGAGPFPVMVLIHGGCWQAAYDLVYITRLADWITRAGWATWTIEYRRLGDPGGGWPGTFEDVAAAADHLRALARRAPLDLGHVVAAGHSAGGQLALWLASRPRLTPDQALWTTSQPLPIHGVLGLAAITDLDEYRIGPADSCHASVEPLLGGDPALVPDRYAQASPLRRLPLRVPQVLVHGALDPIVDLAAARRYVERARAAGDTAQLLEIPLAGHFDVAAPVPASMPVLREALRLLAREPG
jgi:acetyl esterase/lipase